MKLWFSLMAWHCSILHAKSGSRTESPNRSKRKKKKKMSKLKGKRIRGLMLEIE